MNEGATIGHIATVHSLQISDLVVIGHDQWNGDTMVIDLSVELRTGTGIHGAMENMTAVGEEILGAMKRGEAQ